MEWERNNLAGGVSEIEDEEGQFCGEINRGTEVSSDLSSETEGFKVFLAKNGDSAEKNVDPERERKIEKGKVMKMDD